MKRVPLLDLTRSDDATNTALREAFERVLRSGQFILGPDVGEMESECARLVGAQHAIGVSSGTDALLLALMALGIGPGDEVICPTYTFFASAGSIWRVGARPVFVDIEPRSFNLDPAQIEERIGPRTKAVMPVHLYGQCADMDAILRSTRERGLPVIEDAAQAIGARWRGANAGAMGTFGCFSFFPTKNLGCLGDAGLVTTDDGDLASRARMMRVHGMEPKYHHEVVGGNFRIDTLQAAFVRVRLARLDDATHRRRDNADAYRRLLTEAGVVDDLESSAPGCVALPEQVDPDHTYNQFVIRVLGGGDARDRLRAHLTECGIGSEVYYPIPLHLQRCFAELGHAEGDFPVAERAARETLALPVFPDLRPDEIEHVVETIATWCAGER